MYSETQVFRYLQGILLHTNISIMQLKVFARVQGKPQTWDEKDKIFVSLAYGHEKNGDEYVTLSRLPVGEPLMLASFILLSILSGLVLMWLTTAYYSKILSITMEGESSTPENANKKHKYQVHFSVYQGTALVFSCFNICNFGTFVIAHLYNRPNLDSEDNLVKIAFMIKIVTVVLLYVLHLLVAISAVRVHKKYLCCIVGLPACCKQCKFCEWCKCCENCKCYVYCKCCICFICRHIAKYITWNTTELKGSIPTLLRYKSCQFLALFNILVFLQTVSTAFISIFVFLLLYTFRILSVLVFMASSTFCLIVFVATLLQFNAASSRYKTTLSLQACITFVLLVLLGLIVALYLFMLSHGLHTGGLEGFLPSLLPSSILTGIGWYVQSKVL